MSEIACSFGEDSQLTGVYSPPKGAHQEKPCVVFLTAGLLHHIGPTRMHVELARTFAADNVPGFRFDLSGVGDSETSSLGGYFLDRSVSEIKQAINYLQDEYGHRAFVLVGLCSGADDALATAAQDKRITGLVLLNGYAYRAGYFSLFRLLKFYLPRIFMPEKIMRRAMRLLKPQVETDRFASDADQQLLNQLDEDYRYVPPREETEKLLVQLEQEHLDMLLIYTGGEHNEYTYKGQLFAMFPKLRNSPHVSEYYAQWADHTFILEVDRIQLVTRVHAWYTQAKFRRVTE